MFATSYGCGLFNKSRTRIGRNRSHSKEFKLIERAPGLSVKHIIAATEANLIIERDIPEMLID